MMDEKMALLANSDPATLDSYEGAANVNSYPAEIGRDQ